ncbi:MAG TPA: CDP-alcohol phosphatidyltransferase family protein [Gemmatimonadales bacterium]|nr:CDP-alcohol phosphatidyltransferase family protein [Gemmatimonadales bacterium]
MFDEWLRRYKDRLLGGIARHMSRVPPTAVTLLAFAAGLAAAAAILAGLRPLAFALWIVNRVLDGLDGTLARSQGRSSDLGAYLDIIFDFVVYAAIPLALAAVEPEASARMAVTVLLATFYINAASWMYLSALLERRGTEAGATRVAMPAGLVAGAETIVFYGALILLPDRLAVIAWTMSILVLASALQRVVWACRRL